MGAACCIQKPKAQLSATAEPQAVSSGQLNQKLERGKTTKMLNLDNLQIGTIDAKFNIQEIRSFHA